MGKQKADTDTPKSASGICKRILFNRWLLVTVAVVMMYSLAGFFLLPKLLSYYTGKFAAENLKRKASFTEVHFNPFLFKFEASGFLFEEADGRPIIGFERLFLDFELSSIFRWAWTFADIQIEKPSVFMEIGNDGRLNFQALSDHLPQSAPPPPDAEKKPPRFVIQHAEMVNGIFHFSDLSASTPVTKTFKSLNLEFKDISTLPERKGPYVIRANLPDGGTIAWHGELSFQPIVSEGEISISGFEVATAWEFEQDRLNLDKPSGEISIRTRYRFDYQNSLTRLVFENAQLSLSELSLTKKDTEEQILFLSNLDADEMLFDFQNRKLLIPNIHMQDGNVKVSVSDKGTLNWQNLIVPENSESKIPANDAPSTPDKMPWILNIDGINIKGLSVDYTDYSRLKPLSLTAGGLDIFLKASAEIGGGPVKAAINDLSIDISDLALSEIGKKESVLGLDAIALEDSHIIIDERTIKLSRIEVNGGKSNVVRNKDGRFPLMDFWAGRESGKAPPAVEVSDSNKESESESWDFSLGAFELNNHHINLQIDDYSPSIVYDLKGIHLGLKNITNDSKNPIAFEAEFDVDQGGRSTLKGHLSQSAEDIKADISITGISLIPLRPLLTEFTYLTLESGSVSALAQLAYNVKPSGPQVRVDGSLGVDRLKIDEIDTGERFLEWKKMSVDKITLGLSPNRLHIKEVKLVEPGAKIVIYKDRSLNLTKILKRSDESATGTKASPALPGDRPPKEDRMAFPLNIEGVRLKNGIIDFADLSLVLPFETRITDFSGLASGISSDPESSTSLKFEGKVGEFGLSSVEGSLKPFAPKVHTDVSVRFHNVEMTDLSPYSATFAGRKIASGSLDLNLGYKIENSELLGENSVVLERFTLGERVKAPNAVNLPLDLAVALLTDAEGKIDIALPVTGNVDNPEFRYGAVIRKAIVNLITKIVTSPFRALGGLFGGKEEQIDAISFQPGDNKIQPSELKKLQQVAEVLKQRPQLKLVVQGSFGPKADSVALREMRVNRAIIEQMKGEALSSDEKPEMISFDNAKIQRILGKQLESVSGKKTVDDFKAQYEESTGKKPKPVKPYMAVFGRESTDTDYYRAVFEELVRLEPLTESDLIELARRRAEAVTDALTAAEGLNSKRVKVGNFGPAEKETTEAVNTTLVLDVIKTGD